MLLRLATRRFGACAEVCTSSLRSPLQAEAAIGGTSLHIVHEQAKDLAPPTGPVLNHRSDLHLSQLRWCSSSSQGQDGAASTNVPLTSSTPPNDSDPSESGQQRDTPADADAHSSSRDDPASTSQTLMAALDKLVGAAAEFVEQGKLQEAINVLTEGIAVLQVPFPNSTEVGELHNQVGLLLLFSDKPSEAETHAVAALGMTQAVFGEAHILTAKRMLRLGAVHAALGRAQEGLELLRRAKEVLQAEGMRFAVDMAEADFYHTLLRMAAATSPAGVQELEPELFGAFRILCDNLGAESLTVSIALGQQTRCTLGAMERDFQLAEAMFKQEIRLLEACGSQHEAVGLTLYKLATYYYANDLFHDGTEALQKASSILRNVLPEEHDLLVLCKHRQGMLCALGGDHRAANELLRATQLHYSKLDANHVLGLEASAGLELARFRELDAVVHSSKPELQAVLDKADNLKESMAMQIGHNHMLTRALERRLTQLHYTLERR